MKSLLVGVILMASPLRAQTGGNCAVIDCPTNFMPTPAPPSSVSARQKVVTALAAVKTAEQNESDAATDLKKYIGKIRSDLEKNKRWYSPWAIDDTNVKAAARSDREYLRLQDKHRLAIAENYRAHNAAIVEAETAYQLFPPVMDFTGDPRAATVNMVDEPWLPHYSRHEKRDEKTGQWRRRNEKELAQEQLDNFAAGGGVGAARTRGNGVMEFYGQAFTSPEELAVNIYHETSHWVDIAGKSSGFTPSDAPAVSFRTEQHAYERAAAFAIRLGVNPQKHQDLANQFKVQAEISEKEKLTWPRILVLHQDWIGKDRQGSLAMAPAESEISPGDEALLQKMMSEARTKTDAQSREQVEIAHREHDERLRIMLGDLAQRSCANPGSVTQAELDGLPEPYDKNFITSGASPTGLGECGGQVYYMLGYGVSAQEIRKMSTPVPIAVQQPAPQIAVIRLTTPFSSYLPQLKEFAVTACRAPDEALREKNSYQPTSSLPLSFSRVREDPIIYELSSGMGDCELELFSKIIESMRAGGGTVINSDWVRKTVASYSRAPGTSHGYTPPPPQGSREPGCSEQNGVLGCPK